MGSHLVIRSRALYMNARDSTLDTLKHVLTTGSLNTYLGTETLLDICEVRRFPAAPSAQLQSLGATMTEPLGKPPGLEILMEVPRTAPVDSDSDREKRPRDRRVHLPKAKKQKVEEPVKPAAPALDPTLFCSRCKWRYPNTYSEVDKQRHRALADCQRDVNEYRVRQRELKKMQQRLEREDLMNGEDQDLKAKYGGIRTCPHCDESLEGRWGQFKKDHIERCSARVLDKELNRIVGESALIPKKAPEAPPAPDPFAINFTSLRKRQQDYK